MNRSEDTSTENVCLIQHSLDSTLVRFDGDNFEDVQRSIATLGEIEHLGRQWPLDQWQYWCNSRSGQFFPQDCFCNRREIRGDEATITTTIENRRHWIEARVDDGISVAHRRSAVFECPRCFARSRDSRTERLTSEWPEWNRIEEERRHGRAGSLERDHTHHPVEHADVSNRIEWRADVHRAANSRSADDRRWSSVGSMSRHCDCARSVDIDKCLMPIECNFATDWDNYRKSLRNNKAEDEVEEKRMSTMSDTDREERNEPAETDLSSDRRRPTASTIVEPMDRWEVESRREDGWIELQRRCRGEAEQFLLLVQTSA